MDNALPLDVCELASRHPNLDFILGHCGLIDVFWHFTTTMIEKPGFPNTYIETSHVCFLSNLEDSVIKYGPNRFLFGSNTPESALEPELRKIKEFELNEQDKNMILGGNIANLLKL